MTSYSLGIDLGGTNLRIAAYVSNLEFLETILLPTRLRDGWQAVLSDMAGGIRQLMERYSSQYHLAGIAVGSPGPLELPAGRLLNPPNLAGWNGLELRTELEKLLGQQIIVENDANAATFAEFQLGQGKVYGVDSLCMLTLGTGVGNGIVLGGKIFHGMNGMAGEAGQITIHPDGPLCGCGNHGCLEMYASATAVGRMARERIASGTAPALAELEKNNPDFSARDLYALAKAGDAGALAVFEEVGRSLGIGLAALVNTLNLPLYVVGGGMAEAWDIFSPWLFEELRHRSYVFRLTDADAATIPTKGGRTRIVPAALGPDAGLLGACLLPFQTAP
ncbi:MAG: ROK family protein [Acidobacteriaceae bacterium]